MNLTFTEPRPKSSLPPKCDGTQTHLRHYEEQYLAWLITRRDYPFSNEPAPSLPPHTSEAEGNAINNRIYRDLYRL